MASASKQPDFEGYRFVPPGNSEPWIHHVPVDMTTSGSVVAVQPVRFRPVPNFLMCIGISARLGALEYYNLLNRAEYVLRSVRSHWPGL